MKSRLLGRYVVAMCLSLVVFCVTVGIVSTHGRLSSSEIQCGHWCVRRCCELLGAPVEMPDILQLMPPRNGGHSLLQLADTLDRIGLETEGRKETLDTLKKCSFPLIAHLDEPNHFIVITGISENRVHVFDGLGHRTSRLIRTFGTQWSGFVLLVRRKTSDRLLPTFAPAVAEPAARIQFDTLFVNAGNTPSDGKSVLFEFPFRNLGNRDLQIRSVTPDCKCMKVEKPTDVIPPGGHGKIALVYGPEGKMGPFFHEAAVETNDSVLPVLRLKAVGSSDQLVTVQPAMLDLGEVVIGSSRKAFLFLTYTGDQDDFTISKTACSLSSIRIKTYNANDSMRSREWWPGLASDVQTSEGIRVLEVEWFPDAHQSDKQTGTITIHTNVPNYENLNVQLVGKGVPPLAVSPSILNFGEVSPDQPIDLRVSLISRTHRTFRLIAIEPNNPLLHSTFEPTPGQYKAEIRFTATGATAIALNDTTLRIRLRIDEDNQDVVIPLRVFAFELARHDNKSK